MLKLVIEGEEFYDEETNEFSSVGDVVLELEHSLVSLSKWESEYQKPFLGPGEKTPEEILSYIKYMVTTQLDDPNVIFALTQKHLDKINAYVESPQSATTFGDMPQRGGRGEIITSELIYYWMVAFTIPFECQFWHLNRLFSLIKICNIKNDPKGSKKMPRHEIAARNRELNAKRRAELGTSG